MDLNLNASPLPEEDDEEAFVELEHEHEHEHEREPEEEVVEAQGGGRYREQEREDVYEAEEEERVESGVETLRREREERKQRMKRERRDDDQERVAKIMKVESRPNEKLPEGSHAFVAELRDQDEFGRRSRVEAYSIVLEPQVAMYFQDYNSMFLVGMVIDLTNTMRYYKISEWKNNGIRHQKIACKGRDAVPDSMSVNTFVYEVSKFMQSNKQKKQSKYVLVHCTHGFNRTGYMIVNYLVRTQGMSVKEAVERFAAARPPGIYKPDYIDALFRCYNERKPESVICPPTPEWKNQVVDLNGNGIEDEDDDGDILAALQEVEVEHGIMTNDDVLGDEIPFGQQLELQRLCCQALGIQTQGSSFFPGSQPVSLDRAHIQLLRQRYYYATWKADGTRYMMLITREGCYLIDRKFSFRRVQLRFPIRGVQPGSPECHHFTLLDGEMIIDTVPETGEQQRRYLVYDLMMVNGQSKIKQPFHERWKLIDTEIIQPRTNDIKSNRHYRYDMEAFRVRRKNFWMLSAVGKLLRDFIPTLSHEADGLIFQGWDDPYVPRTHDGLLKWKYAHMNSVDFLFEVGEGNRQSMCLMDKGKNRKLEGAHVTFPDGQDPSSLSGKIIECSWNPKEQCWEYMRVRPDKPTPNGWQTYMKVMRSIEDNITENVVLDEITEIICLPMYAERIRHEQKMQQRQQAVQAQAQGQAQAARRRFASQRTLKKAVNVRSCLSVVPMSTVALCKKMKHRPFEARGFMVTIGETWGGDKEALVVTEEEEAGRQETQR
ncbi:hypothetical protein KI387_014494 [Taxus chinensis]|uniref:mRNA guanylyltransferase n=1 Tax=Taxus chinensis TaxID=29808 RepID=A0AA38CNF1_TAXCH|nr:hypothetical protein KI387_014494 [Taxus chinensis]